MEQAGRAHLSFHAPGLLFRGSLLAPQKVHLCEQGSLGSSLGSLQLSNLARVIRLAGRLHKRTQSALCKTL